jgi:hypothetical protein
MTRLAPIVHAVGRTLSRAESTPELVRS